MLTSITISLVHLLIQFPHLEIVYLPLTTYLAEVNALC